MAGPLGPRAAVQRPNADPDAYSGAETWFKDCSGAGAADGTVPTASWFNHLLGNLRYAAKKAGVPWTNDQTPAGDDRLYALINQIVSNRLGSTSGTDWQLI